MQYMITYLIVMVALTAQAKKCENHGDCNSNWYCENEKSGNGTCVKMIKPPGACNRSVACLGGSHCENGTCSERCRSDPDCLVYRKGRHKYCTSGGLVTLVKGYCELQKNDEEVCSRHQECKKKRFCKNGTCKKAEEVAACTIKCVGPHLNPQKIKIGDLVNVTYSCTFGRQGPSGPMPIVAQLLSNRKIKAGSANGTSPLTISGEYSEIARGGVFTHEIRGEMKKCINNRKFCKAGERCILRT
ncbi:unnamed protein product [Owenia fusiformis]|uniref:Uncharacterized protein n=1 Tax=Owenia fusiformis TaxID=6347 RepID=A0A8J1TVT0_OWEFU|nr:unnamed protein product [Owenia fusiformis]